MSSETAKKKNGILRFFPLLIFLLLILIYITLSHFLSRTVPNQEGAVGNTACNLYNGGTFCLYDDTIYFANALDNYALYSMSTSLDHFKRIHDDQPGFLNATNHYLVYARMNYKREGGGKGVFDFTSSGLFRIGKNGKGVSMFYKEPVGSVSLTGNQIFFQQFKGGDLSLHRIQLNGSNDTLIDNSTIVANAGSDGLLYYAGTEQNHNIYSYHPQTGTETLVYQGNCYMPAKVGSSIYFLSLSQDYSIARINSYGGDPTLLVQERCSAYNVDEHENYLIYQADNTDTNKGYLGCLNLNTLENIVIQEGNFNNIHILGDLVIFGQYGTNRQFYFRLGETNATLFEPEVIK